MSARVLLLLAVAGCSPELALFEPDDTRCGETYCASVGRVCGEAIDPCGARWECGTCAEGATCSSAGRCALDACALSTGEALELGRYPGFRTRPTAFATTTTHLYFWTAFPTSSTPGSSSLYLADKCGGDLVALQQNVGQDDRESGYTIAVDATHVYFANQRQPLEVFRAPLLGGEREALTEPLPRVCGLVVDEARDRVIFARCDRDAPGIYTVPRAGGDVTPLFDGSPSRRVVSENDRLVWIDRDLPGLGVADLASGELLGGVVEPTVPRDVVLDRGEIFWLRPLVDRTEVVTLTVDGPFVLAVLGPDRISLAVLGERLYVVDDESPMAIDRRTGDVRRLAGRGGEHVYADADGLYVTGTEPAGDNTEHVIRRYGL